MGRGRKKNKGMNIEVLDLTTENTKNNDIIQKNHNADKFEKNSKLIDKAEIKDSKSLQNGKINNKLNEKISNYQKYKYINNFINQNWNKINCYNSIDPIIIEEEVSEEEFEDYFFDEY